MNKEQGDMHQKPTECQRQLMHRGWHINEQRIIQIFQIFNHQITA